MSISNTSLDQVIASAREGRLTLFCGAGISMLPPSQCASWWEIYRESTRALLERWAEAFPDYQEPLTIDDILNSMTTQQLADLVVKEFAGDTFVEMLKVIDVADPNDNHMWISALVKEGYLQSIITTNWDTLLERAGAIGGVKYGTLLPDHAGEKSRTTPTLIKLHGSAVDAMNLKETFSQKTRAINLHFRNDWQLSITKKDLLVIGFSGADLDVGMVHAFFDDFVQRGQKIYWLYRPGNKPSLPDWVASRTTLMEGSLPGLLHDMADSLNVISFPIPLTHRRTASLLAKAMTNWSHKIHIGKWAAAAFLTAVIDKDFGRPENTGLVQYLTSVADGQCNHYQKVKEIKLNDFAVSIFLSRMGILKVKELDYDHAERFLRTAVNQFEAIHRTLGRDSKSFWERCTNLSSTWGDYAHVLILKDGKASQASFLKSLGYAYAAANPGHIVNGLFNFLNCGKAQSDLRQSLKLVRQAVRLADNGGNISSSIELRFLQATCHIERNELRIAQHILEETRPLIQAVRGEVNGYFLALIENHIRLKRGEVRTALTNISAMLKSKAAMITWWAENLRGHLKVLGVDNTVPFTIELPPESVPGHLDSIEREIKSAALEKRWPWRGEHCAVFGSAGIDTQDCESISMLGLLEFDQQHEKMIRFSLQRAEAFLNRRLYHDAYWYLLNVLHHPEIAGQNKVSACLMIVYAEAELGEIDDATVHLKQAISEIVSSDLIVSQSLAEIALWFCMQAEHYTLGLDCAKIWMRSISDQDVPLEQVDLVLTRLRSFGPNAKPIVDFLFSELINKGISVTTGGDNPGNEEKPFRIFTGMSADSKLFPDRQAQAQIDDLEKCIGRGDLDGVPEHLERINKEYMQAMSSVQKGRFFYLQVRFKTVQADQRDAGKHADEIRFDLLKVLDFSALAFFELEMMLAAGEGKREEPQEFFLKRHFLSEFLDDGYSRAYVHSVIKNLRSDAKKTIGPYYRLMRFYGMDEGPGNMSLSEQQAQQRKQEIADEFLKKLMDRPDAVTLQDESRKAIDELNNLGNVDSYLGMIHGNLATWYLNQHHYQLAIESFHEAEQLFSQSKNINEQLNAMAGHARALNRSGQHEKAIEKFREAIQLGSPKLPIFANLHGGLATAHVMQAATSSDDQRTILLNEAGSIYTRAIQYAALWEKPFFKLGLARVNGEKGELEDAITLFDEAIAELAHAGHNAARLLMENRERIIGGDWYLLGLM